jgi:hypothetical protein
MGKKNIFPASAVAKVSPELQFNIFRPKAVSSVTDGQNSTRHG